MMEGQRGSQYLKGRGKVQEGTSSKARLIRVLGSLASSELESSSNDNVNREQTCNFSENVRRG
jgi:hypothetical protein